MFNIYGDERITQSIEHKCPYFSNIYLINFFIYNLKENEYDWHWDATFRNQSIEAKLHFIRGKNL